MMELSPHKKINVGGDMCNTMKDKLHIDGFNNFNFRDSHDQYLQSDRNNFGRPSKHCLKKTV